MSDRVSDETSIVYGDSLQEKLHGLVMSLPWWAISFVLHVGILVFAWFYTWEIPLPKDEVEIATDIREKSVPPPVMLDLPKATPREQELTPKRRTETKKLELSHRRLPELTDILKNRGTPNPELNVLTAPNGVMPVGGVGDGEGFRAAGGLGDALGDLSDGGWWKNRCLAVWLFDESKSMKDDQQIVRQKVDELYENLGINQSGSAQSRRIVTAVCSYGKDFRIELKDPTTDMEEIRRAIDKVPVDPSGEENFLKAINGVLSEFSKYARKYSRNIVIVMVTDEAGDDDTTWQDGKNSALERTLSRMKKLNATLLVFGDEAGGFAFPRERTYDPTVEKGYSPYAWVNRGLDTAFGEMFPHSHYFRTTQRIPSGFGPYALSRLCKETGGVYYLLRSAGARSYDYEKLLSGYEPELAPRVEIARRNGRNVFRHLFMELVEGWNNILHKEGRRFQVRFANSDDGREQIKTMIAMVDEWLRLVEDGIRRMKVMANVAFKDSPKHWEANRDLMWAQLHKSRFRLIQFKLALLDIRDRRNVPPPGDIGWAVSYWRRVILRGRDMNQVHRELEEIKAMYQKVIDRHAGTPWEAFARSEMRGIRGYAIVPWSRSRGGRGLKGESR